MTTAEPIGAGVFRPCAVVPTYDNPETIRRVVLALRRHVADVVVVDDGSHDDGRRVCQALADEGLVHLVVRARNGGKGAAVKDGLRAAQRLGFTHALQVDADGQHALDDVPRFLNEAARNPNDLVLGAPRFDASAPRARRMARKITSFWIHIETGGFVIEDAMCGFRVYPLPAATEVQVRGDAMDFDPEIAVKLYWSGVDVRNLPTQVRYLSAEEGGVSHFRNLRDNALISWMHTRLCLLAIWRTLTWNRRPRRAGPNTWLSTAERGTVLGIQILVFCATLGGRRFARLFLRPIALYFAAFDRSVRRASRDYHRHLGGRGDFRDIYRHVLCFAGVALDRLFFVRRKLGVFRFRHFGHEHLEKLQDAGRGAILLGAHLGSFEAMRSLSHKRGLYVNIVGYFKNARMINHALEKLDPECNARVIDIGDGEIESIFRIKACIERGELVAILGDRVGLTRNTAEVDFLGGRALVPTGAYVLAATLKCPVYLTFGLYHAPNCYDLYCEPFAEQIVLPRKSRKETLAGYARQYATRLEHYCKLAPDNWFNFFDFWSEPTSAARVDSSAPATGNAASLDDVKGE